MKKSRVFLVVLDSFGIGEMPDAADYGDEGSNTLRAVTDVGVKLPNLTAMGLYNIEGVTCKEGTKSPLAAYARLLEASKGKDTTTGHWEMAGIVSAHPMPTYPAGFPQEVVDRLEESFGRKILCNKPYSGTDVIRDYGEEHLETGALIVYTSADSVLQIAAHEEKVPLDELYSFCKKARAVMQGEHGVGRIIARPFVGEAGNFIRTANRHDYSLVPPHDTMLDIIKKSGKDVIAVGKISDIFAGAGVTESTPTKGNTDGMEKSKALLDRDFDGLCFINLVDFDMLYGHRNDAKGYAAALEEFDSWLGDAIGKLRSGDVLIITADHGCDPSTESTDHSRESVPMLVYGDGVKPVDLGTKDTFACIGSTVLGILGVYDSQIPGENLWPVMKGE